MVDFTDLDDIEMWLAPRPRDEVVAVAARAALRVAPQLGDLDLTERRHAAVALGALRCLLTASAAGALGPAADADLTAAARTAADAARAAAARTARAAAAGTPATTLAARTAARTAARAAAAADARTVADAAAAVLAAAIAADAAHLEAGYGATDLLCARLWPDGAEPNGLGRAWSKLRRRLLDADPSDAGGDGLWRPWADWLDARRNGAPFDAALHRRVALIPDDDWKMGPAQVNPIIAAMVAENGGWSGRGAIVDWPSGEGDDRVQAAGDALPPTIPLAPRYARDAEGRYDYAAQTPELLDREAARQRAFYDELREAAEDLAALGHNMLGDRLHRDVTRYATALGGRYEALNPDQLWMKGDALRNRLAQEPARRDHPEPQTPPLGDEAAELLSNLVNLHNVFSKGDARLTKMDEESIDPAQRRPVTPEMLSQIGALIDEASEQLLAEEPAEDLRGVLARSAGEDPPAIRDQQMALNATDNLVVQMMRDVVDALQAVRAAIDQQSQMVEFRLADQSKILNQVARQGTPNTPLENAKIGAEGAVGASAVAGGLWAGTQLLHAVAELAPRLKELAALRPDLASVVDIVEAVLRYFGAA